MTYFPNNIINKILTGFIKFFDKTENEFYEFTYDDRFWHWADFQKEKKMFK